MGWDILSFGERKRLKIKFVFSLGKMFDIDICVVVCGGKKRTLAPGSKTLQGGNSISVRAVACAGSHPSLAQTNLIKRLRLVA
jgi:hypothetical protein